MEIWLVDAFTQKPFGGNPAGVCLVDQFPRASLMQGIAREMHWSQTTFVKPISRQHYHIRWFSPRDEPSLCGHATLAAAHILWQEHLNLSSTILLESLAGPITVKQKKGDGAITMSLPTKPIQICQLHDTIQDVLGDARVEEAYHDPLLEIVVLSDVRELAGLEPCLTLLQQLPCRALCVTAAGGPPGYDFSSRYFAPKVGIAEDPVCGSAHCRLSPYWSRRLNKPHLHAYQMSKRGGSIQCRVREERVELTGYAVTMGKGSFTHDLSSLK